MAVEEESEPQKPLESKQKVKRKSKNKELQGDNSENIKPVSKQKQLRNANAKKKRANLQKLNNSLGDNSSEFFDCNEIANNKEASGLISELVQCYTDNSNLPEEKLDVVNRMLHDKTVSVFSDILNKCVEKLFIKLINSEYLKDLLNKKVIKKDAYCQTDTSLGDSIS